MDTNRFWEKIKTKPLKTDGELSSKNLIILSYNILSQTLLEQHAYLYLLCPKQALNWNYRFGLIMSEIRKIEPDIVCLQEVQFSHLDEIKKSLNALGFETLYKKRTGNKPDGCAISYQSGIFQVSESKNVEFFNPKENVLSYDNVCLMAKLFYKENPRASFVVCTTHLLFNRKRHDARLAQLQVLLAELDDFSLDDSRKHHLPILLTGDFNSNPQSAVAKLVTSGKLKDKHYVPLKNTTSSKMCQQIQPNMIDTNSQQPVIDQQACNNEKSGILNVFRFACTFKHKKRSRRSSMSEPSTSTSEIKELIPDISSNTDRHVLKKNVISHNFIFKSVYSHLKARGQPEATVFQKHWQVADYIYYSSNGITGTLILQEKYYLPTALECHRMRALPSFKQGSDHLSLAAKFILYFNKNTKLVV